MKVVLADYGAGNLRSVCSALARAGAEPVVTSDPAEVAAAPSQSSRGSATPQRAAAGLGPLADVLRDRVPPAGPSSASVSGSSCSSNRATKGARGWVSWPAGFAS